MLDPNRRFAETGAPDRTEVMAEEQIRVDPLTPSDVPLVVSMIRRNLEVFEEAGAVLASTFRRIEHLSGIYSEEGARFFVAKDLEHGGTCIGGAGLGPLAGLPASEGMGEVRDMVLDKSYRGHGIGTQLLKACLEEAKSMGYRCIYLQTTPQMEKAQKLFMRFGFRPVTQGAQGKGKAKSDGTLPHYFILEDLASHSFDHV